MVWWCDGMGRWVEAKVEGKARIVDKYTEGPKGIVTAE